MNSNIPIKGTIHKNQNVYDEEVLALNKKFGTVKMIINIFYSSYSISIH